MFEFSNLKMFTIKMRPVGQAGLRMTDFGK